MMLGDQAINVVSPHELKGKDLLCLTDYSTEQVNFLLDLSRQMKERFYAGERVLDVLRGRSIAMIFEKPSTRTRVSLEVAAYQLGALPIMLSSSELQLGRGETVPDTARTLSRFVDAITARVRNHGDLVTLARHATVPVINALSDLSHPLQALADYLTIYEKKGKFKGLKLAFVGDGSDNMLHSLMAAGAKLGVSIYVASPASLKPSEQILKAALSDAEVSGAEIKFTERPEEAVDGADVVYTDVWVSMGQESMAEEKRRLLSPYQVNSKLMERASSRAIFMHCLPAHRGEEVTDDVIEGPWSVVWDEAENRLHTEKAVLAALIP
ncbi:MAG: ornithine carbamoyltransferase [Acidilobus sp.]